MMVSAAVASAVDSLDHSKDGRFWHDLVKLQPGQHPQDVHQPMQKADAHPDPFHRYSYHKTEPYRRIAPEDTHYNSFANA